MNLIGDYFFRCSSPSFLLSLYFSFFSSPFSFSLPILHFFSFKRFLPRSLAAEALSLAVPILHAEGDLRISPPPHRLWRHALNPRPLVRDSSPVDSLAKPLFGSPCGSPLSVLTSCLLDSSHVLPSRFTSCSSLSLLYFTHASFSFISLVSPLAPASPLRLRLRQRFT